MATNRKIGNSFETEFCELLFQHGFWCHNMAQNAAGNQQMLSLLKAKRRTSLTVRCVQTTDSLSREWKKISTLLWKHGKPVEMARAGSHSRLKTKSL